MIAAMPTITTVPTMALPNPPPISKPAGGSSVKRLRLSREPPRTMSIQSTETRGMPAMTAAVHTPIVSKRLVSARRSNGDRSRRVSGTATRAAAVAPGSLMCALPSGTPRP